MSLKNIATWEQASTLLYSYHRELETKDHVLFKQAPPRKDPITRASDLIPSFLISSQNVLDICSFIVYVDPRPVIHHIFAFPL